MTVVADGSALGYVAVRSDSPVTTGKGLPAQPLSFADSGNRARMNIALRCLLLGLLPVSGQVLAQSPFDCPTLPPDSGLQWQKLGGEDYLFCKALTADGTQVMGIMLTPREPKLSLPRNNREEQGKINDENFYWYVPDLAGREGPASSRRIATVEVGKKRYAQITIDAGDIEQLHRLQGLAERLDMGDSRQVASGQ